MWAQPVQAGDQGPAVPLQPLHTPGAPTSFSKPQFERHPIARLRTAEEASRNLSRASTDARRVAVPDTGMVKEVNDLAPLPSARPKKLQWHVT